MKVGELIKKLQTMPYCAEVKLVKVLTENEFEEKETEEYSSQGKTVILREDVFAAEHMRKGEDDYAFIYAGEEL